MLQNWDDIVDLCAKDRFNQHITNIRHNLLYSFDQSTAQSQKIFQAKFLCNSKVRKSLSSIAKYNSNNSTIVSDILGQSGFDWDGTNHMITVENENAWNEYCTISIL